MDALSFGGEQQRIVLAGHFEKCLVVLTKQPPLPTPETTPYSTSLRELNEGKTVLMIAHRLTTVQDADKILVVNKGEIAEQGTHQELITQKGIYNTMWNEYQKAIAWTF